MKNILKFIIIAILLIPLSVFAQSYEIKDYKIKIELSNNWDVFTRDNLNENVNLSKYNITYDYLYNFMQNNLVYLDAIYQDNTEMLIRINPGTSIINNLSNFKSSDLNEMANELIEKTGATDYNIFESSDLTYIKSLYYDNNAKAYILEYVTVVNGNNITFTIQNYSAPVSQSLESEIDQTIKSASIEIDPSKAEEQITSGFDWNIVIKNTLIGGTVGAIIGAIGTIFNRKKKKV